VTSPASARQPTSATAVTEWLKLTGETAAADVAAYVAAVNVKVAVWHDPDPDGTWPPDITLGATMLAGRLYRRRNNPAGLADFAAEGPVFVQRNDPDIAMLLRIGAYTPPRVG
jgi:hypothetical protein